MELENVEVSGETDGPQSQCRLQAPAQHTDGDEGQEFTDHAVDGGETGK